MASEFVLLSTLVAAVTFGLAAVIGSAVGQPLDALGGLLSSLGGS